jgi:hypothetical protein
MNTKSLLVKGAVVAGGVGLLATLGATAASASTGPATVTAVTHEINVPDTTSGTATSVPDKNFGAVWAWDNVTKQFKVTKTGVTPAGAGIYSVVETVHGTFRAFDEPNTPDGTLVALNPNVTGSIDGTNTYTVTSNAAPDPAGLAAQYDDQYGNDNPAAASYINYGTPGITTGDLITHLFGDDPSVQVGGGNAWVFTYKAGGNTMTQAGNTPTTAWGNITS